MGGQLEGSVRVVKRVFTDMFKLLLLDVEL